MRHFAAHVLLFLSTGLAAQWNPLGTGMLSNRSMTSLNGDLYVATYPNGVKKSAAGTGPWTAVNTGLPQNAGIVYAQSIGTDGSYLYTGTESGIYRCAAGSDTWSNANGSLAASTTVFANKFFAIGGNIMAVFSGTIAEGGGIWRSANVGNTWLIGHSGMGSNATVYHLTAVGGTIWASTSTGLWKSTDNAQSWTQQANVNYAVYSLAAINGRLVIASTFGIRYSIDDGVNWQDATGDPANPSNGELIAFDGKLYALFDNPTGCIRSTDNGTTWSDYNTGFSMVDQASQEEFFASGSTLYCTALFDVYSITGISSGLTAHDTSEALRVQPTAFIDGFHAEAHVNGGMLHVLDATGRELRRIIIPSGQRVWIPRENLITGAYLLRFEPTTGNMRDSRVLRVLAL